MQIVVNISKELYETILNLPDFISATATQAIRDGIPLPKGHGKLIDADKVIQRLCSKSCGCTLEECGYGAPCPLAQRMNSAQIVIEADKEYKNETD